MKAKNALSLVLAAGVVAPAMADVTPQMARKGTVAVSQPQAHIYFNVVTGEKVATLLGDGVRPAGVAAEVWVVDNDLPCAVYGQVQATAGIHDSPSSTGSSATGATYLEWGDIAGDSVIDAVGVEWALQHADTDTDSDDIGDGVAGLGIAWSYYDGDNGFNTCFTRTGLVAFALFDLPGQIGPFDPNLLTVYTATVDLAGGFSSSISFEIGDSDSDPQGAAFHNAGFANGDLDSDTIPDGDLDGDGLADFAYAKQWFQPGTVDWDSDTLVDGDPAAAALTAWGLNAPSGDTVFTAPSTYSIDVLPAPAGQGVEEGFDIYTDLNSDGFFEPVGTFWYGGFTCDEDGNGTPGGDAANYRPYSQFSHTLFGAAAPVACRPDLFPVGAGDGQLNFFDISTFLQAFNAQQPAADFFPAAAGDGAFNFFDVSTFLSEYNAGCP
jgi:hypothetical protein